jgi:DNA-binding LytR/AlgR family response regulator
MEEAMLIPVIYKSGNTDTIYMLPAKEILYVAKEGDRVVFHTRNETYYQITTLEDYALLWNGMGFERTDRVCVVNLSNIQKVDYELGIIHFGDDKKSKFATISQRNIKKLKGILENRKSNHDGNS